VSPVADLLLTRDVDHVRLLTLNRPERRNALSPELVGLLDDAFGAAAADDHVHVIVLTGAGSAFCAGLDMDEYLAPGVERSGAARFLRSVASFPKPVIAALNGAAVTGGMELALNCDFIVADPGAWFRDTHLAVGVFPGAGMTARLPLAVGARNAKFLAFTGSTLSAADARMVGLVSLVSPEGEVVATAMEVAATIASRDPTFVAEMREAYGAGEHAAQGVGLAVESTAYSRRRWARQAGATGAEP
jgi:enoyl-CoA hydratase